MFDSKYKLPKLFSGSDFLLSKLIFWSKPKSELEKMTAILDEYYHTKRTGQFKDPEIEKWIKNGILREMSLVVSGEKERIRVSLFEDNVYQEAVIILSDMNRYYDLLEPQPETAEE